jgi:FkbM family methyltransferase
MDSAPDGPPGASPASPVSDLVCCSRLTAVVDIGANPFGGDPPYKAMLEAGLCTVTGFEPQPDALAELHRRKGPFETYLPHTVGDGETHCLRVARQSGMTSLLRPDPKRRALFHGFTEWGTVIEEIEVSTCRLDDIEEVGEFDFLKIDIQGGELMTFQNGRRKLADAVAVQTEVSFVPLYRHQPVFGEVDLELRSQGFMPHSFPAIKRWPIAPSVIGPNFQVYQNQLLEADVVYVRDIAYPERLTDEQLSQLAMIAFHVYGSIDLALFCVLQLSVRGRTSADSGARFLGRIG